MEDYWATWASKKAAQKKKQNAKKETRSDRQRHKMNFHVFKPKRTHTHVGTNILTPAGAYRTDSNTWRWNERNILHHRHHHRLPFLIFILWNHSSVTGVKKDDPDNIVTFINPLNDRIGCAPNESFDRSIGYSIFRWYLGDYINL